MVGNIEDVASLNKLLEVVEGKFICVYTGETALLNYEQCTIPNKEYHICNVG
jgi:hypothetical protein